MKHEYKLNNILFNKIKWRYHLFNHNYFDSRVKSKIIAESFYPGIIADKIIKDKEESTYPYHIGPAITDRVAQELNVSQLHISELTTMLKYTKTDIGKIIQAVKRKRYKLNVIGAGGSMSNFLYWTSKMAEWVGKKDIFYHIKIFEFDNMDTTNLLRIPYIPEYKSNIENLNKAQLIPTRILIQLTDRHTFYEEAVDTNNLNFLNDRNSIIIGAPDIETRQLLNDQEIKWFALTHQDNIAKITYRQQVNVDNIIETYGKIHLPIFFINQLNMTIHFLIKIGNENFNLNNLDDGEQIYKCDFDNDLALFYNQMKAGNKKVFVLKHHQNLEYREEPGVMQ